MAATKVTQADFEEKVLKSDVPVLVDFWADWCGPCKMLSPIINEIADEAKGFKVMSCDADENPDILERYGIRAIPTLIVFKNGDAIHQSTGFIPKEQVLKLLED
ncbi:MAG: thioredoxin [Oribacterium sp.]|jgi:thioredoxin 1|nr:thioredoxin [Oribacterium sp.]MDY6316316.1 thioredoxin [Oribacterium sp.]